MMWGWRRQQEPRARPRRKAPSPEDNMGRIDVHFLLALAADLVILPAFSTFSTVLMTPTATVCLISRTAKRPRGGYSENDSTHIGFDGTSLTMQASPDFTVFGFSSRTLPERRSILVVISENLHAMCAVWQSSTGDPCRLCTRTRLPHGAHCVQVL